MRITSIIADRKVKCKKTDGKVVALKPAKKIKYFIECADDKGNNVKVRISQKAYNKIIKFSTTS